MNDERLISERQRLDAESRHYRSELGRAAKDLELAARLAPVALRGLRRLAPALPYVVLVSAASVVILRLRARSASKFLLVGGLLFDAMRLLALARSVNGADDATLPTGVRALKGPENAGAAR